MNLPPPNWGWSEVGRASLWLLCLQCLRPWKFVEKHVLCLRYPSYRLRMTNRWVWKKLEAIDD